MDTTSIIEKINGFLVEEFEVDPDKIQPTANLRETLELDSLDYIDLVVVVESNFGFKVKPEDFTNIDTFKSFYDYVTHRVESILLTCRAGKVSPRDSRSGIEFLFLYAGISAFCPPILFFGLLPFTIFFFPGLHPGSSINISGTIRVMAPFDRT